MAGGFTDDVAIQVEEDQVLEMLFRLEVATSQVGIASWATTEIDPWLQMRAADRFDREGDAASGAWVPLSSFTSEWRDEGGFPAEHPINVRTGALRDYITHEAEGDWFTRGLNAGQYVWPGAALPYTNHITAKLKTAQLGVPRGENPKFPNSSTPRRPVVAVDATDMRALLESYANYVETFVGDGAGSMTVSGVFGGSISTPAVARGAAFSEGGGNFS